MLTVVTKSSSVMAWWMKLQKNEHEFPQVSWDKMLVDAMTVRMTLKPETLDTIVAVLPYCHLIWQGTGYSIGVR